MRRWYLLLIVLVWSPCAAAAPPHAAAPHQLRFQSIGVGRTFRPEIITEVAFDHTGFMWIGTREGLYLYDGQRFRQFQHEVQNPASLSSNGIRGIYEDSRGRLWINTISGGLDLLDRATWTFRSWRHQRNDPTSIAHDGVFAVTEAAAGKLWVGTQAGLDLFDPATGRFQRVVLATGGEFIIALMTDRDGRLWVATLDQGLFRQRDDRSGFDAVPGVGTATPHDIFSLAQTRDGTIWVGTRHGLYRYDATRHGLIVLGTDQGKPDGFSYVTDLLAAPDGGLWIGTFGVGLYWLGPDSEQLKPVALGARGPGARQIDGGAMALGRDGTLFVGTFGAGMFRASRRIAGLEVWHETRNGKPGLTNQDVYTVQPRRVGGATSLLVGSFGGGVDEISLPRGGVRHLALPGPASNEARLNGVTDLMLARDGSLWATTNEGVYHRNLDTGAFHFYQPDSGGRAKASPGYSFALLEDREGRIWVGSAGDGLYLYRPRSDDFRRFQPVRGDPASLPDDFVTALLEDRRGRLWVGTRSGGIGICTLAARLRCHHLAAGGAKHLSHDHVAALLAAPDGSIWVGLAGGGLNRVVLDAAGAVKDVQRWSREGGLVDNNVMAMVYAPDGALWLSSHGGLSRLDPVTGKIANLTPTDGLPTAVFNPKAAVLVGDKLYFGSAKGVVAISPQSPRRVGSPPPTVIESVTGADAIGPGSKPAWQLDRLDVAWRSPVALDLAVLGYDGGAPRFQYRLQPTSAWIDLGDRGRLTLHGLAPGRHRLEVRGRLDGQPWTLARPLTLDVIPPWWRRTAVQIGTAIALLLLIVGGFWWRVNELSARNRELRRLHDARAEALVSAYTSQQQLETAYASLRRMTMRLETAKEKERRHLARELHDEFGQTLTSAKIHLGLALAGAPEGKGRARIRDTIGLMDRLIAQVRALSFNLRPPLLDELGLVPALEGYLNGVAERSGLRLDLTLDRELDLASPEQEIVVFRIVQEAVTNVLRHADARTLEVEVVARDGGVAIRVRDDGCGFDDGAIDAVDGAGLGLFGMRERAHDLGGEWRVESAPGDGTVVTAFIPAAGTRDAT